jgi:inactivated superfamily I helicase
LRLDIQEPSKEELEKIVKAHFLRKEDEKHKEDEKGKKDENVITEAKLLEKAEELIEQFLKKRDNEQENLATDQLLNAIYLITRKYAPEGEDKQKLIEQLFKSLTP